MAIDTQGRKQQRGECRYCGCWERDPCSLLLPAANEHGYVVLGCWWVNAEETVCSMPLCQKQAIAEGLLKAQRVICL